MNNELLSKMKEEKKELYSIDRKLRKDFEDSKERGESRESLVSIASAIREVDNKYAVIKMDIELYTEAYRKYTECDPSEKSVAFKDFQTIEQDLEVKYCIVHDLIDEDLSIFTEESASEKSIEPKKEEIPDVKRKNEGLGTRIIAGILAVAMVGGLGYLIGKGNSKKSDSLPTQVEETMSLDTNQNNSVIENIAQPFASYGSFTDASNNEQVMQRAQVIYDTYYSPMMNELSANEREYITVERIANIIRVMNGELPLDENGNKDYSVNTVDDYGQAYTYLLGDIPSSPNLSKVYNVPAYVFATDNSELAKFIIRYDKDYEQIAEGRNANDASIVRAGIASLGEKFWKEWSLQGLYGDTNPYNLEAKDRLMAFLASFARYGQYAFEYNLNAMSPVCIDACIDYFSKELKELNVNEIFIGYTTGQYDSVIAKAAGIEYNAEPDSIAFTQDLQEELEYKNSNALTLKQN